MSEMHKLTKVIYDEILRNIQFGGKAKDGIIVLEADHHKLSHDIARAVTEHLQDMIASEITKLVNSHILRLAP